MKFLKWLLAVLSKLMGVKDGPDYSKMPALKYGDKNANVKILQARLKELGYFSGEAGGNFLVKTRDAVKAFQIANGLSPDGEVGAYTWKKLAAPAKSETPWMDWMYAREGWKESNPDNNKELSKYWKYSGLDYTSISGAKNAWCQMTVNAALHDTGYKPNGRADAKSAAKMGTACEAKYGAIVSMRHTSGGHHVGFFIRWVKPDVAELISGNSGDSLRKSNYNLSGNSKGHDELLGIRWPDKQ
jgi:Putative peptidoglycan binding domain